jgi:chromosome segregation ATPase
LEGLEWGTKGAVNKLKKMLWGLEALRVFNDRLSSSLSQIQKAQDSMERTIKQVGCGWSSTTGLDRRLTSSQDAGQQHADLIQEYNNLVEEFKKRYGMLADVQDRMQVKIRQVTGLRDGVCFQQWHNRLASI